MFCVDVAAHGSDTGVDTQKKPGGFFGYTQEKNDQNPTLNLIAFYYLVTCFAILKLYNPLVGHYLAFLDILKYWFLL